MTTENKKIQEERIKGYFVEATKKTLKGEGLKAVNVRTVAKEAGYSYATLYNYFKDIKYLVFECVKDFQTECAEIVENATKNSKRGIPKIKAITHAYIKYFIQYPGIFELFYIEGINNLGSGNPTISIIYNLLDDLCEKEWQYCIKEKLCTKKEAALKKETLKYVTVGLLLFYINRHSPSDYKEFISLTERQINGLFS